MITTLLNSKFIFIRHGNSLASDAEPDLKHPLSVTGVNQATGLREALSTQNITHAFVSPAHRAMETSTIALPSSKRSPCDWLYNMTSPADKKLAESMFAEVSAYNLTSYREDQRFEVLQRFGQHAVEQAQALLAKIPAFPHAACIAVVGHQILLQVVMAALYEGTPISHRIEELIFTECGAVKVSAGKTCGELTLDVLR